MAESLQESNMESWNFGLEGTKEKMNKKRSWTGELSMSV